MTNSAPPPGWQFEQPRFRATRDLRPSPNGRHKFEPPFASISDNSVYQFATQPIKAGEEIETKSWPHESFFPLNYSAKKVLDFFNSRPKS